MNKIKSKVSLFMFIILFSFVLLNSDNVLSHSPSGMTLEYDIETDLLSATITHSVSNPQTHYIDIVEVRINSVLEISEVYTSQPTSSTFTYQYTINATIGDTLEVKAICNQGGTITRSITIADPTATTTPGTTDTPTNTAGFALIPFTVLSLIFLVALMSLRQKQK